MVNQATTQRVEHTRITGANQSELLVAHRMAEAYLGAKRPLSLVIATYVGINVTMPLSAVDKYPINQVNDVLNASGVSIAKLTTNDDRYVWPATQWPTTTMVVHYLGGIEPAVMSAIVRQAEILATRDNNPPESTELIVPGGGKVDGYDPRFRTGLASDIKHMLFPYKVISF